MEKYQECLNRIIKDMELMLIMRPARILKVLMQLTHKYYQKLIHLKNLTIDTLKYIYLYFSTIKTKHFNT